LEEVPDKIVVYDKIGEKPKAKYLKLLS